MPAQILQMAMAAGGLHDHDSVARNAPLTGSGATRQGDKIAWINALDLFRVLQGSVWLVNGHVPVESRPLSMS